jgi:hypothetical protein
MVSPHAYELPRAPTHTECAQPFKSSKCKAPKLTLRWRCPFILEDF